MVLVLDFDETYTAFPEMWDLIIPIIQQYTEVVCCTMRYEGGGELNADIRENIVDKHGIKVVYAALFDNKMKAMEHAGYDTEHLIWVDDSPYYITMENIYDRNKQ